MEMTMSDGIVDRRNEARQLLLWCVAILFFGFGDTFTSLMVFQRGGSEANVFLGLVLILMGRTVWGFLLIKSLATVAIVLLSRSRPHVEGLAALTMLAVGLFLVAQNSAVLFTAR